MITIPRLNDRREISKANRAAKMPHTNPKPWEFVPNAISAQAATKVQNQANIAMPRLD